MLCAPLRSRRLIPAARRPGERGLLHGLSLVALTAAIFGALAYFAMGNFPLTCACSDGIVLRGFRSGLDVPKRRCEMICSSHGGGVPTKRAKDEGPVRDHGTKASNR